MFDWSDALFDTESVDEQTEKRQALISLLSTPDETDFRRGHHLTVEGRPDRYVLLPHLTAAFVQRHLLDMDERRMRPASRAEQPSTADRRIRAADSEWLALESWVAFVTRMVRWPSHWLQVH